MSTMAMCTNVIFRVVVVLKTYSTDSAPQQMAKMALTVMTIMVIRFRTLITPCK